jgi:sigma-B regulation protein RsbU (phosphoserine phosphatase)
MVTKRGRSECLSLDADGLILGVRPNVRFEEKILLLQPGDVVLLYTDGVIEASNASGEFYGAERLAAELVRHRDLPIGELARTLLDGVRAHCGPGSLLDDDTSLLLLRVL